GKYPLISTVRNEIQNGIDNEKLSNFETINNKFNEILNSNNNYNIPSVDTSSDLNKLNGKQVPNITPKPITLLTTIQTIQPKTTQKIIKNNFIDQFYDYFYKSKLKHLPGDLNTSKANNNNNNNI